MGGRSNAELQNVGVFGEVACHELANVFPLVVDDCLRSGDRRGSSSSSGRQYHHGALQQGNLQVVAVVLGVATYGGDVFVRICRTENWMELCKRTRVRTERKALSRASEAQTRCVFGWVLLLDFFIFVDFFLIDDVSVALVGQLERSNVQQSELIREYC